MFISLCATTWEYTNVLFAAGAASPQAVKKLLALSEQTKPRHKSHPGPERDHHAAHARPERPEQPPPVSLTPESSSVTGRPKEGKAHQHASHGCAKTKVRKVQNSIESVTSTDSGFGAGGCGERVESPLAGGRRRYHHHYRQHHHHGRHVTIWPRQGWAKYKFCMTRGTWYDTRGT